MDPLAQYHYEFVFALKFREARGDAFQQFVGRIFNMAYPGDFVQTRPWGRKGDEKCDGFLSSKKRLFACYAPNDLSENETLAKLRQDFDGALPFAGKFFDEWYFVHNAPDGRVPTWLVKEIERLRAEHPEIRIEMMGFEEMRAVVFGLSATDLVSLLGPQVTQRAMLSLGLEQLKPILAHLAAQAPPEDVEPTPVSPEKLAYNALPQSVNAMLTAGMTKARLLENYVARGRNKELGMQVATAFRKRYAELVASHADGLEIFNQLHEFAIGPFRPDTNTQVACLAVLAWLFEACDIFEHPPETR
jgi:hypothetical protein